MNNPAWPTIPDSNDEPFPQSFLLGVSGDPYRPIQYSTFSTGPASARALDDIDFMVWTGEVMMTDGHLSTFKTWLRDTIRYGAINFLWKDPHTREEKLFKLMAVNSYAAQSQHLWKVGLTIQEVP